MRSLPHKTALVTGGAGGIGLAIANKLAEGGTNTIIADPKQPVAQYLRLFYHNTDITSAESVARLYTYLQDRHGIPDLIVCNAGQGIKERLAEGDPEKWHNILNLNVMGHLRTIRAFLPQMLEKSHTTDIVFISSVAARKPHEWGGIYAASKAAIQSIAETLRLEVQPKVRVSTVLPGVVDTDFFSNTIGGSDESAKNFGWGSLSAEEVAEAVCYIISRPAGVAVNEITIRPAAQAF
ncbi:SDR family oxidoreductase [Cesiribacter sp. SM1]|uniref:SDR family oxidoreductase n=1 Tax=Cesiribacter sp. SM1 TaxID=2861196 RepID=UPI001CD5DDE2|nr:SDR family NAD(P)-dependent oxidoreductase [Cesiribacter sp. SM1]